MFYYNNNYEKTESGQTYLSQDMVNQISHYRYTRKHSI